MAKFSFVCAYVNDRGEINIEIDGAVGIGTQFKNVSTGSKGSSQNEMWCHNAL